MGRNNEFIPEEKLAKALNVFWSKRYKAAFLFDLTGAMKLNKSSFYNSFKDKHNLFNESLTAYDKIVKKDDAIAIKDHHSPTEKIKSIIERISTITTDRDNSYFGMKLRLNWHPRTRRFRTLLRAGTTRRSG